MMPGKVALLGRRSGKLTNLVERGLGLDMYPVEPITGVCYCRL